MPPDRSSLPDPVPDLVLHPSLPGLQVPEPLLHGAQGLQDVTVHGAGHQVGDLVLQWISIIHRPKHPLGLLQLLLQLLQSPWDGSKVP